MNAGIFLAICLIGIVLLIILGASGLLDEIFDYAFRGKCRHDWDKWTEPDQMDKQCRTCKKCGLQERTYR